MDDTYQTIDRPYDALLQRDNAAPGGGGTSSYNTTGNGNVQEATVKSDGAMSDVWIKNSIRSENWAPKSIGFYIDGQTGYAEFSNVFIGGGITAGNGQIGGFTIGPTSLSAVSGGNSTIISSGTTAFSAGPTGSPTVTITQAGIITAVGAIIDGTSTLGGRLASTVATAINSSGHFIDNAIDTSTKNILGSFSFGVSGALQIGTFSAGVSGDIKISPAGIVGRNSSNINTFTIDATTGNASFRGNITGSTITGTTITGGTIQTAASGQRVEMANTNQINFYNNSNQVAGSMLYSGVGTPGVVIFAGINPAFSGYVFQQFSFYPNPFLADLGNPTFPWGNIYSSQTIFANGKLKVPVGTNLF